MRWLAAAVTRKARIIFKHSFAATGDGSFLLHRRLNFSKAKHVVLSSTQTVAATARKMTAAQPGVNRSSYHSTTSALIMRCAPAVRGRRRNPNLRRSWVKSRAGSELNCCRFQAVDAQIA